MKKYGLSPARIAILVALAIPFAAAPFFRDSMKLSGRGTVSVRGVEEEQHPGLAKATLAEAVMAAQQEYPGSQVVMAGLDKKEDYLVYQVQVVTPENKVTNLTFDAGDLKMLARKDTNGRFRD